MSEKSLANRPLKLTSFLDSALIELASGRGWTVAGETVHIRKQEELIKPKKILAKIEMESEFFTFPLLILPSLPQV